jgi:hypothetical protein
MISYEELCQALDRFTNRRKNEDELSRLEAVDDEQPPVKSRPQASSSAASGATAGFAQEPHEDTHEIDVEEMVMDEK